MNEYEILVYDKETSNAEISSFKVEFDDIVDYYNIMTEYIETRLTEYIDIYSVIDYIPPYGIDRLCYELYILIYDYMKKIGLEKKKLSHIDVKYITDDENIYKIRTTLWFNV